MKCEFTVIIYDGVARIGSTLKSYDDIGFLSKHVSDLAFTLISPICSYYCSYHNTVSSLCLSLLFGTTCSLPVMPEDMLFLSVFIS